MELRFVTPENPDFAALAQKLDEYYLEVVGEVHLRYAALNHPANFACRAVIYTGEGQAVACGCWKPAGQTAGEIKRIYVLPPYRRQGLAGRMVKALEENMAAAGCTRAVLETARTTEDSARLYLSLGYRETEYYGSPAGAENCRCFEKTL